MAHIEFIARIGAFAVAFGVCAALAGTPGVAQADPTNSVASVSDSGKASASRATGGSRVHAPRRSSSARRDGVTRSRSTRDGVDSPPTSTGSDDPAAPASARRVTRPPQGLAGTALVVPDVAASPGREPSPAQPDESPLVADRGQPFARQVTRRVVSRVLDAVSAPLAGSGPVVPAAPSPLMWTVAAAVRHEFERWQRGVVDDTSRPVIRTVNAGASSVFTAPDSPEVRTLVLTAFPAETDAVLARTVLDPDPVVMVDGRHFYLGTLGDKKVIVATTGIGMVNATRTTESAFDHFTPESGTEIGAVVFSGVAGGADDTRIADVAVPARWTLDGGATWHEVDAGMLAAAQSLHVELDSVRTLGSPVCASCFSFPAIPLVDLRRDPQVVVGGDGSSGDGNNGQAFPCIPFGGDIFGCEACSAPGRSPFYLGNFVDAIVPFVIHGLLSNVQLETAENVAFDAVDQETAAAQAVVDAHGVPFLGIRGMSDGPGDPLHLPGFPFQFAFYREIAADNAAAVTESFMRMWPGPV